MGRWKQYVRVSMISLLAMICAGSAPAYAAELGTVTSMSEKVYKEKNIESGVVGNVIAGTVFSILSTETDETGVVWRRVKTDVGTEGYIPAQNVAPAGLDGEAGGAQSEETGGIQDEEAGGAQSEEADGAQSEEAGGIQGEEAGGAQSEETGNSGQQIQIMETINIRNGASTDTEIVGKIRQGETISYLAETENELGETWYEIEYNGVHGYVRKDTVMEMENADNILQENGLLQTGQDEGDLGEGGNEPYVNMRQSEEAQTLETDAASDGAKIAEEAERPEETETIKEEKNVIDSEEAAAGESGETGEDDQAEKVRRRLRIDWIAVISLAGSLFFAAVAVRLAKRLIKICGRVR